MTAGDEGEGLRLCRASGWNQVAEDWRVFLDSAGGGAVAAERDGKVLGTAAYLRYGTLAWIAMMLVDPAERRTGIGTRLLQAALESVSDAERVGLDATPAGEKLYNRTFGFEGCGELVRLAAVVDESRLPRAGDTARRMKPGDARDVYRLDAEVFGADRTGLLARLVARAPELAWVRCGDGGVTGFCLGRRGHLYDQLGPIVAPDSEVARDLAASCLRERHGTRLAIDANPRAGEWMRFLNAAGFVEERRFLRMYARGREGAGIAPRQYAICGPEFG